jgi:hypothetical protein
MAADSEGKLSPAEDEKSNHANDDGAEETAEDTDIMNGCKDGAGLLAKGMVELYEAEQAQYQTNHDNLQWQAFGEEDDAANDADGDVDLVDGNVMNDDDDVLEEINDDTNVIENDADGVDDLVDSNIMNDDDDDSEEINDDTNVIENDTDGDDDFMDDSVMNDDDDDLEEINGLTFFE